MDDLICALADVENKKTTYVYFGEEFSHNRKRKPKSRNYWQVGRKGSYTRIRTRSLGMRI